MLNASKFKIKCSRSNISEIQGIMIFGHKSTFQCENCLFSCVFYFQPWAPPPHYPETPVVVSTNVGSTCGKADVFTIAFGDDWGTHGYMYANCYFSNKETDKSSTHIENSFPNNGKYREMNLVENTIPFHERKMYSYDNIFWLSKGQKEYFKQIL